MSAMASLSVANKHIGKRYTSRHSQLWWSSIFFFFFLHIVVMFLLNPVTQYDVFICLDDQQQDRRGAHGRGGSIVERSSLLSRPTRRDPTRRDL